VLAAVTVTLGCHSRNLAPRDTANLPVRIALVSKAGVKTLCDTAAVPPHFCSMQQKICLRKLAEDLGANVLRHAVGHAGYNLGGSQSALAQEQITPGVLFTTLGKRSIERIL
jgi:hypothetical protein